MQTKKIISPLILIDSAKVFLSQRDVLFRASLCLFLGLFFFLFSHLHAQSIPKFTQPINDYTNTLNFQEVRDLLKTVKQFEDSSSNQIAVVIISSLNGNDIRELGIQILKENAIGQKGKDNGVLILVAKEDKKISIEVGYGLEGVLTDALCDQIIRNEIRPQFREGNYYEGIKTGIISIIEITKGEYKSEKKNENSSWFGVLLVIGVIFFALLSSMRSSRYGITSRGYRNYNNWWGGSGFGGGSGGGFGSFGGGGGGGSWSAGGGSFGGGGASGSW